jgi:hypothetical protein
MAFDVIVGIGYNGCDARQAFYNQVKMIVQRLGKLNALITGDSYSEEWGYEKATWYAASFESFGDYIEARDRILAVAATHNQDAVAFTVGNIDVPSTPKPEQKPLYRDFL